METAWKKLKTNIISATEEAVGKRKIKNGKKQSKSWFCKEIKELAKEKR